MAWDGSERRRKKRYGVKDAVVRYKKDSLGALFSAASRKYLVLNLSETGIEFMTRDPLKEGGGLKLYLDAPGSAAGVSARAQVVWARKARTDEAYRIGARITSMSARSKTLLKSLLDNAVIDSVEVSTRVYLREIEKL